MATFNSTTYTAQKEARVNTSRLHTPNVASGKVEFAVIPITLAGTETADDVINLALLPAGAIPLLEKSSVTCSADPVTGDYAALTLDIGTAANPDGWADGIDLDGGGQVAVTSGTMPAWIAPTPLVADTNSGNALVYATLKTCTGPVEGVVLYFTLAFKRGR